MKTSVANSHPRQGGGALIVTLATVTALSFLAAYTLTRAAPRLRMAYQNAAWQEARVAAEAGIDSAMNDLILNATGFHTGTWPGWKQESPPGTATPPLIGLLGQVLSTTTNTLTDLLGGILNISLRSSTSAVTTVNTAAPIYLDNIRLSASTGIPTEVDIRLWALEPEANPNIHWFRIRCMATCELPPGAGATPANLDAHLRRFSLKNVRPSLRKDDPGKPSTIRLPNVSRTIEVLVEPIHSYELALWTGQSMSLPHSGSWNIDSFDSTDPTKSGPGGIYPGRGSAKLQMNGHIASSASSPFGSPAGPVIAANGTKVSGAVTTDGGDDPETKEHENVSGAAGINPARIHADFNRQMIPLPRPAGKFLPPPPNAVFATGSESAPKIYSIHGSLTDLHFSPPAKGTGCVVLMIDGNLDLAKPLTIPPSVIAILFVRGQITFRANVNSGPGNSNLANHLLIFGDSDAYQPQVLRAEGSSSICAAFYGPRTEVTLDGKVDWIGSLSALTFRVDSGGSGGIHYDESLAGIGPVIGYRIARYIEDVRE